MSARSCGPVRSSGAPGPRLRVLGLAGAYVVDALDGQEDRLRQTGRLPVGWPARRPGARTAGWCTATTVEPVPSEPGRWDLFYPAVLAAMRGEGDVPVDPADAVRTLQLHRGGPAARPTEHRVIDLAAG